MLVEQFLIIITLGINILAIVSVVVILILATISIIKKAGASDPEQNIIELMKKAIDAPYNLISKFVGENVGFGKGTKWYSHETWRGYYIEHITLFYWIVGIFLVVTFPPAEPIIGEKKFIFWSIGIVLWLGINITMDSISLLITKYSYGKIAQAETARLQTQMKWLFIDFGLACVCFGITQTVTNGVYAIQMGLPDQFLSYMFDYSTALKEYVFNSSRLDSPRFPGQLVVSGTSYLPTIIGAVWMFFFIINEHFFSLLKYISKWLNIPQNMTTIFGYFAVILMALGVLVTVINSW